MRGEAAPESAGPERSCYQCAFSRRSTNVAPDKVDMTFRWTLLGFGTWLLLGSTPTTGAPSGIVIAVGDTTASSPGIATFAVTLSGVAAGGVQANNAQVDIIFDTTIFAVSATGSTACAQFAPGITDAHRDATEQSSRSRRDAAPASERH